MIFIDANQYLRLYRAIPTPREVLDALVEQKSYIFVTDQIVDEVGRKKLQMAGEGREARTKLIDQTKLSVPKELWDVLGSENRPNFDKLQNEIDKCKVDLQKEAELSLEAVSKSEDDVSQALQTLFAQAVRATELEIQNAQRRKERGNPPGKWNDPLGDQINWEQLLSHCAGKNKIWIITSDRDYFTRCGEKRFLNGLLLDELKKKSGPSVEVYCFEGILTGIEHFVKTTNAAAQKLPSPQKAEEIDRKLIASDDARGVDSGMVVPFLMTSGQLPHIQGTPFPYGFQHTSGGVLDWIPLNEASGYSSLPYLTFLYLKDDGDEKVTVSHAPIAGGGGGPQTMFRIQSVVPLVPPIGKLPSKDFFDWLINLPAGTRKTSFKCW